MCMTPAKQQSVSMTCMQGANQAAAAASLGYPTYFLGQVIQLVNDDCPLPVPTQTTMQTCILS